MPSFIKEASIYFSLVSLFLGCNYEPCFYEPEAAGCPEADDDSATAEDDDTTMGDDDDDATLGPNDGLFPNSIWHRHPEPIELVDISDLLMETYWVADTDATKFVDCRSQECVDTPVFTPYAWDQRCFPNNETPTSREGTVEFPPELEIADAYPGWTPNGFVFIYRPDGETAWELGAAATCNAPDGSKYIAAWQLPDDGPLALAGDGLHRGARGGSGLTSGLVVTADELAQCDVDRDQVQMIDHAVFFQLWFDILALVSDETGGCYRWPALNGDSYCAATNSETGEAYYAGTDSRLTMGSWLVIDPDTDCDQLADSGRAGNPQYLLCEAMKAESGYGGPVSDDSYMEGRFMFGVDEDVDDAMKQSCGYGVFSQQEGPWYEFIGRLLEHVRLENQPQTALQYDG